MAIVGTRHLSLSYDDDGGMGFRFSRLTPGLRLKTPLKRRHFSQIRRMVQRRPFRSLELTTTKVHPTGIRDTTGWSMRCGTFHSPKALRACAANCSMVGRLV